MKQKEKRLEIIKESISKCIIGNKFKYYVEDIPRDIYNNARKRYASDIEYKNILAIIDTSNKRNGSSGIIITVRGICLSLFDLKKFERLYIRFGFNEFKDKLQSKIERFSGSSNLNTEEILNMVKKLFDVERNKKYEIDDERISEYLENIKAIADICILSDLMLVNFEDGKIKLKKIFSKAARYSNDRNWFLKVADSEEKSDVTPDNFSYKYDMFKGMDEILKEYYEYYDVDITLMKLIRYFRRELKNLYNEYEERKSDCDRILKDAEKIQKEFEFEFKQIMEMIDELIYDINNGDIEFTNSELLHEFLF